MRSLFISGCYISVMLTAELVRQRERETETERQRKRERERQRDRVREREKERERKRRREVCARSGCSLYETIQLT